MGLKKAIDCIKNNRNFLITTHTNMEADALGSVLAFARLLEKLDKHVRIICDESVPYGYDFLPNIARIKKFSRKTEIPDFEVFVVLDCSDLKRTGQVQTLNSIGKPVLNIDHHISNTKFGSVNWIEASASSTCEMVYRLYKRMKVSLDKKSALLLYAGIATDTGYFRYSNTTDTTHRIAAALLKFRLNVSHIYSCLYENIPFKDMKFLSSVLPTMKRALGGKIIWYRIRKEALKKQGKLSFDLTEHILSFARSIKDVEVVVLFKENLKAEHQIRVNLRSQGKIDVNKIAQFFGGGGHKTASGCTIEGKLEEVERRVLKKIKSSFR